MTELGFTVIEEGEEPEEFWILLGGKEDYGTMLHGKFVAYNIPLLVIVKLTTSIPTI